MLDGRHKRAVRHRVSRLITASGNARDHAASKASSGLRIFARFSEREDIEILLSNASLCLRSPKCQHWRVNCFVSQLESAEVHREAAT